MGKDLMMRGKTVIHGIRVDAGFARIKPDSELQFLSWSIARDEVMNLVPGVRVDEPLWPGDLS
ncbi:MAG: hypothetical protein ACUVV5_02690 [Candidatus Aminicenantales bacterium]